MSAETDVSALIAGTSFIMKFPIDTEEWRQLSAADKLSRCKLWADEARKLAYQVQPDRARSYILVAEAWEELAAELGRDHFTKLR